MYEKYFPKIDIASKGLAVIALKEAYVMANFPKYGYGVSVEKNTRIGYLTGYWTTENSVNFVQVFLEAPIINEATGENYYYAYVDAANYRTVKIDDGKDAKTLINNLIGNNKNILENNLLCAGIIAHMQTNGVTVPTEHKKQLYALQNRLQTRNGKILNNAFIDTKQTAKPSGFDKYNPQLQGFMDNPRIGIAPIVIYIVVSVVFSFLVSAILYLIFKPDYTDSKADLIVSKDLTKALATLSPEARAAVISDLEGQIDAAYVNGKMNGSGMGMLKTAGYVVAGFLGYTILEKFINRNKK